MTCQNCEKLQAEICRLRADLLDKFAAAALSGLAGPAAFDQPIEDMLHEVGIRTDDFEAFVAHMAAGFADAMLAEREKRTRGSCGG